MAKSAETASASTGGKQWILISVLAVVAIAAGAVVPFFLPETAPTKPAPQEKSNSKELKPSLVPFGDPMVVNLNTNQLSKYLRTKIILVVDEANEKTVRDLLEKNKPFLKTWLIAYLSDQSLRDVTGAAAINRLRREIRDQFNTMLFPDGSEKINDVLFEEFYVQ
ncbi:MAG TPA: flagellar basal body-associated FliL family protein [Gemmataceae bacterium]|nr:flagellar basal body-associated FliL family protein [Gemmataceae bacterium]